MAAEFLSLYILLAFGIMELTISTFQLAVGVGYGRVASVDAHVDVRWPYTACCPIDHSGLS